MQGGRAVRRPAAARDVVHNTDGAHVRMLDRRVPLRLRSRARYRRADRVGRGAEQMESVMRAAGVLRRLALVAAAAVIAAGCARQIGGEVYEGSSLGAAVDTRTGVIESARFVQVQENDRVQDNRAGQLVGGLAGGVAGSRVGQGFGKAVAIGAGAILGVAAGSVIEDRVSRQSAVEYVVRLDDGGLVTVVQGTADQIAPGSRVFVQLGGYGSRARVIRA